MQTKYFGYQQHIKDLYQVTVNLETLLGLGWKIFNAMVFIYLFIFIYFHFILHRIKIQTMLP